jgi:hypothetical protein
MENPYRDRTWRCRMTVRRPLVGKKGSPTDLSVDVPGSPFVAGSPRVNVFRLSPPRLHAVNPCGDTTAHVSVIHSGGGRPAVPALRGRVCCPAQPDPPCLQPKLCRVPHRPSSLGAQHPSEIDWRVFPGQRRAQPGAGAEVTAAF